MYAAFDGASNPRRSPAPTGPPASSAPACGESSTSSRTPASDSPAASSAVVITATGAASASMNRTRSAGYDRSTGTYIAPAPSTPTHAPPAPAHPRRQNLHPPHRNIRRRHHRLQHPHQPPRQRLRTPPVKQAEGVLDVATQPGWPTIGAEVFAQREGEVHLGGRRAHRLHLRGEP